MCRRAGAAPTPAAMAQGRKSAHPWGVMGHGGPLASGNSQAH